MVLSRQSKNFASSVSVLAITISLVAAQSATQKSLAQFATSPAPSGVISINGAGASTLNTLFVGTGATIACPLGSKGSWFNVFGVANPTSLNSDLTTTTNGCLPGTYGPVVTNDTFRYASVGSGAGVTAFFNPPGTPTVVVGLRPTPDNNVNILSPIAFAGSDDPLTPTQIEQIPGGTASQRAGSGKAIQVPVVGVGITLAFNRTGLNVPAAGLRLSRITYCSILNGTITNWNDARIRTDNGGAIIAANLPIRVVRRSDNSGSTFVLSNALNHICNPTATPGIPAAHVWNRGVGSISVAGTVPPAPPTDTVVWPSTFLSASGGGGVASLISSTSGAIGYVDSATRLARSLPAALLQNKSGAYVGPTTSGIQHALQSPNTTILKQGTGPIRRVIRVNVSDPTLATAYPISTASYMLFYDVYGGTNGTIISTHIRTFINWALGNTPVSNPTADAIATARGYAPLPANLKTLSREVVNTCVDTSVDTSCSTTP